MISASDTLLKSLIFFFPLAVYQISFGGIPLSIDRLILIFSLPIAGYFALKRLNKISFESFFYTLFISYALVISTLYQTDFSSYGNMLLLSVMFFYVCRSFWTVSKMSIEDLKGTIYLLTIILLSFSLYTLIIYFITSKPPLYLPFEQSFSFISSEGLHVIEEGGFGLGILTRVALPFARPQDLGMTCAILSLLLLSKRGNASKLIFAILFLCLILSASRSAIFPFLISLSIFCVIKYGWGYFFRLSIISTTSATLVGFTLFAFFGNILDFFLLIIDSVSRIGDVFSGTSADRHFSVRFETFEMIFESPSQTIFGSGIGSFQDKTGVSSAHSTYITLFHDVGLLGLLFFLTPLITLAQKAIKYRKIAPEYLPIVTYILLAHILYEVPNLLIFWIVTGILSSQMTYTKIKNV